MTVLNPADFLTVREGPIEGWRAWGMRHGDLAPASYGASMADFRKQSTYVEFWSSCEVEAVCPTSPDGGCSHTEDRRVPGEQSGHLCGIHAYASWSEMQRSARWIRAGRRFGAKLELDGKLIVHDGHPDFEHTLRGERARILYAVAHRRDEEVVARIAERWGVPLVVVDAGDSLQPAFFDMDTTETAAEPFLSLMNRSATIPSDEVL